MNKPQLTPEQQFRLQADDVEGWRLVGWWEGTAYETVDGRLAHSGAGPLLRDPSGRRYRITPGGRLQPLSLQREPV